MSLAFVVVPAITARADDPPPPPGELTGTGSVSGTEIVQDQTFTGSVCFEATKSIFGLRGAGTYYGRTAAGQNVVYQTSLSSGQTLYGDGPIHLEVENTQTYYHGPFGTHGTSDASCSPATAGSPVPAKFRLFATDHVYRLDASNNQVPCTGQGSFERGNSSNTNDTTHWYAEWNLDADCTVGGNASGTPGTGVAPAGTAMTDTGQHDPCFNPPCTDNIRVDYKQYLPYKGLHLGLSGPTAATAGGAVTLTAAVTNDGQPVANALVNFSVAGPAPSAPPAGAAATGSDGRASFTFTAATAGDYTVTGSVTTSSATASASTTVPPTTVPPTTVPPTTVPATTTIPTTVSPTT
ncbi:MAG: Ig-like domain-containing protein, partial [Actinobacteria bacterium]|nr:Ig-like domain-containing protein [Actinomycetota bacterium]